MKKLLTICFCCASIMLFAQEYQDYIGAGHSEGITITTSDEMEGTSAINTINAEGMNSKLFAAGRFLNQATISYNMDLMQHVMEVGYEAWLDEQLALGNTTALATMIDSVWQERLDTVAARGFEDPEDIFGPSLTEISYAWSHNSIVAPDKIRQKMAWALSQIMVISTNSELGGEAIAVGHYYDMLLENALGNYKDLLTKVALHPNMGYYLSHLNNPKANPAENVHPDENFAREIMQLFSIGLFELNIDGTEQLDENGQPIPTYDNGHIKELAEVFTGLGAGALDTSRVWWTPNPYFGLSFWGTRKDTSMAMYADWHDTSDKYILKHDTLVFPQGLTGQALQDACMQDVYDAIDILFNHPNVGPFIGYRLIQRFVKSNPTPAYVQRVAEVFNDNGDGVRGDLSAVIKAILLDEEARDGSYMFDQHSSRLKEPVMRRMQTASAVPHVPDRNGRYWQYFNWGNDLKQQFMRSPSVFNFYLPNHQPVGEISALGYVGPEYKIHDTGSSIHYFNEVQRWGSNGAHWTGIMRNGLGFWDASYDNGPGQPPGRYYDYGIDNIELDLEHFLPFADDIDLLINEFDKHLTHGQLSDELRGYLREQIPNIQWGSDYLERRIQTTFYLICVSPDFTIIR